MAAAGTSSSSLHIEECDFTWLILSQICYLVLFSCVSYHPTAKYKTEKLIAKKMGFEPGFFRFCYNASTHQVTLSQLPNPFQIADNFYTLCKLFKSRHNYSIFNKIGKDGGKLRKFEYLKNQRSGLGEIRSISLFFTGLSFAEM